MAMHMSTKDLKGQAKIDVTRRRMALMEIHDALFPPDEES